MISREESRQYLKYTLSVARIKLLYEKITLTQYTSLYFFSALLACIVLSALQVVSLVHDSEGVVNISSVLAYYNRVASIAVLKGDTVQLCSGLPDQSGTLCTDVIDLQGSGKDLSVRDDLFESDSDSDSDSSDSGEESDDDSHSSDDEDSDDEDDIVNEEIETSSTTSTSVATNSPSLTEVVSTLSTTLISSTEGETSKIASSSTTNISTVAPTPSSSSSIITPTLTVVTTTSNSITTSSSIFSSIAVPQVSSTTSFIFSLTVIPTVSSTTAQPASSTTSSADRSGSTVIESSGTFDIPVSSSSRQQPSATVVSSIPAGTASPVSSKDNSSELLEDDCIVSLTWLNDVIHDTQREDIVIFVFQIWLFFLSVVTVLNESIPHLGAGFFGHVLGTAWAGYRACNGRDIMGDWWENRIDDGIALLALQAVTLVLMLYLSFKLFNIYVSQTYKRVGASSKVYVIYKLVLVFSVCLQLSGFISVASAALWIDKVSHGSLSGLAKHAKLYLGAFIVTLLIQIPWVVIGWICVRRESRIKISFFCVMSAFSFAISFAMFYSDIYRFLVSTWPFFATMTIIAFILVVGTTVLGIFCRLKFGGGLAQHLRNTEEHDDESFNPVYFTNKGGLQDIEKFRPQYQTTELPTVPLPLDGKHYVEFPVPLYASGPDITTKYSGHVDARTIPTPFVPAGSVEARIVPVTRMSVFSKALKEFSMRAPSPSVKSIRPEPLTHSIAHAPFESIRSPPISVSDTGLVTPGGFTVPESERGTENASTPKMLIPPSPMDTVSAYSFVTPRQTLVNEEMPVNIRKGGASSYQRQSSGSAYSATSRKYGLPANPRQSTASSFSFRSGSVGTSANPRESVASKFSFTTRSAGFPENPRSSIASDTLSVNSRLVGLPANPRSRMVTESQSYNV